MPPIVQNNFIFDDLAYRQRAGRCGLVGDEMLAAAGQRAAPGELARGCIVRGVAGNGSQVNLQPGREGVGEPDGIAQSVVHLLHGKCVCARLPHQPDAMIHHKAGIAQIAQPAHDAVHHLGLFCRRDGFKGYAPEHGPPVVARGGGANGQRPIAPEKWLAVRSREDAIPVILVGGKVQGKWQHCFGGNGRIPSPNQARWLYRL